MQGLHGETAHSFNKAELIADRERNEWLPRSRRRTAGSFNGARYISLDLSGRVF